ncbi:hypothetical protein ACFSC6_15630 [Rufibacter sediminis]
MSTFKRSDDLKGSLYWFSQKHPPVKLWNFTGSAVSRKLNYRRAATYIFFPGPVLPPLPFQARFQERRPKTGLNT